MRGFAPFGWLFGRAGRPFLTFVLLFQIWILGENSVGRAGSSGVFLCYSLTVYLYSFLFGAFDE